MFEKKIPLQSVIIDSSLVCQYEEIKNLTAVIHIGTFIRNKADISILHQIPRIDLGNRQLNNQLLNQVMNIDSDELLTVPLLMAKYKPTEKGLLNPTRFPELNRYKRLLFVVGTDSGIKKIRQLRKIKRELLENSAKICMNPNRINRLIESGEINMDDTETLYDI